ncbi:MAG: Crp/Fnr family transcriptional regulator [Prevotella sp.]|nr:Crp/Fnr family transcriptional regulator [Prevotella sp.]
MATLRIYDQLLQFPLFQGMSRDDLEIIAGHIRFGFVKVSAGKPIVQVGESCTQLCFLINGTVRVETFADEHRYMVAEQVSAPYVLQQEAIFGYYQSYTHNFTALTDVNLLTIAKEEVLRLLEDFLVFRLNLVNLFATQTQKHIHQTWRRCPSMLRDRLIRFLTQHCIYPAGPKTFYILMEQLAEELNDSRLNVSRILNQFQKEGLVELHRGRVDIPQLERLLM